MHLRTLDTAKSEATGAGKGRARGQQKCFIISSTFRLTNYMDGGWQSVWLLQKMPQNKCGEGRIRKELRSVILKMSNKNFGDLYSRISVNMSFNSISSNQAQLSKWMKYRSESITAGQCSGKL